MPSPLGSIRSLRSGLANNMVRHVRLAGRALENTNGNLSGNTYLWRDPAWTRALAERLDEAPRAAGGPFGDGHGALWGLTVSVKDCFDLAGAPTSCGVKYYRDKNGIAKKHSWLVERLIEAGAVITGKTHLHPLAYGITGQNPQFGDCLQPGDAGVLTGGSSSGAAASVMEGSAVAAIGTDTGGSIRVPAALCGLAGYRASLGRGDWSGAGHLAPSFDTMGWLFADLEDAPLLAGIFTGSEVEDAAELTQFAYAGKPFLHDCDEDVRVSYREAIAEFEAMGLRGTEIDVEWWNESREIFAPIQASEAAAIHRGNYHRFETAIRDRLEFGSRITAEEMVALRARHAEFRNRMDDLLDHYQLVMLPAAPVSRLAADADHSETRVRLLRYTTPFSLAGVPAVTVPCKAGGVQLAAGRESDEALLQVAARIGAERKASSLKSNP